MGRLLFLVDFKRPASVGLSSIRRRMDAYYVLALVAIAAMFFVSIVAMSGHDPKSVQSAIQAIVDLFKHLL